MDIDDGIDNTLNNLENLLLKLKNEDKDYNLFYKNKNKAINICYIYIDNKNNINYIKEDIYELYNNEILSDDLYELINNNKYNNKIKYDLYKILKYNIDLDPRDLKNFLIINNEHENSNYLYECNGINNIVYDDTIMLLQEINTLYILYRERNKNNKTRKIYIKNKKSKNKYTRKKV